jgi:hypothetical protein
MTAKPESSKGKGKETSGRVFCSSSDAQRFGEELTANLTDLFKKQDRSRRDEKDLQLERQGKRHNDILERQDRQHSELLNAILEITTTMREVRLAVQSLQTGSQTSQPPEPLPSRTAPLRPPPADPSHEWRSIPDRQQPIKERPPRGNSLISMNRHISYQQPPLQGHWHDLSSSINLRNLEAHTRRAYPNGSGSWRRISRMWEFQMSENPMLHLPFSLAKQGITTSISSDETTEINSTIRCYVRPFSISLNGHRPDTSTSADY